MRARLGELLGVLQAALAAGLAWVVAHDLANHRAPIFAPVAALTILSSVPGRRTTRVAAAALGTLLGVGVGDVVVAGVGTGGPQLALVAFLTMGLATLVRAQPGVVTNAGIAALLIATIQAPHGLWSVAGARRLIDVLCGGGAALAVSVLVPTPPLRTTRAAAARLITAFAEALDGVAGGLGDADPLACERALERARQLDGPLAGLQHTAERASETVRLSPHLRGARVAIRRVESRLAPLELAVRNSRVLARDAIRVTELDSGVAPALGREVGRLAEAIALAGQPAAELGDLPRLFAPSAERHGRTAHGQLMLRAAAGATAAAEATGSLAAMALAAQLRATVTDLLQVGGLERAEAVSRVRAAVGA